MDQTSPLMLSTVFMMQASIKDIEKYNENRCSTRARLCAIRGAMGCIMTIANLYCHNCKCIVQKDIKKGWCMYVYYKNNVTKNEKRNMVVKKYMAHSSVCR